VDPIKIGCDAVVLIQLDCSAQRNQVTMEEQAGLSQLAPQAAIIAKRLLVDSLGGDCADLIVLGAHGQMATPRARRTITPT